LRTVSTVMPAPIPKTNIPAHQCQQQDKLRISTGMDNH
jgi:hypothetical protein